MTTFSPIRDQRSMVGSVIHHSPQDVERAWGDWATEHGFPARRRAGDYTTTFREDKRVLRAYISGGKWVADCPNCGDGIAAWPENDHGACLGCGTLYVLSYPSDELRERAIEILMRRPEHHRSWNVHKDETIEALEAQNTLLGWEAQRQDMALVPLSSIREALGERAVERLREKGAI